MPGVAYVSRLPKTVTVPPLAFAEVGGDIHPPMWMPVDGKLIRVSDGWARVHLVEVVTHQEWICLFLLNAAWERLLDRPGITKGVHDTDLTHADDSHQLSRLIHRHIYQVSSV